MASYNYIKYLEESIKTNWNVLALADYKKNPISYGKLGENIYRLHATFESFGVQKGDKIALLAKNSSNWATVFLATITYGAVIVPLLSDFKPDDVHKLVNHSEAKYFFISKDFFSKLDVNDFTDLNAIVSVEDFKVLNNFDSEDTASKIAKSDDIFEQKYKEKLTAKKYEFDKLKADDLMVLSYTSGTSGVPKGVMIPHRSISANVWYARKNMPLGLGDPVLSFLPLAHMYGCAFEFLYPLTLGCFVTFLGAIPSPSIVMRAFADIKPRLILTVPLVIEKVYKKKIKPKIGDSKIQTALKVPILRGQILKKINKSVSDSFGGNFKEIVIGGAPLNKEVEDFFKLIKLPFSTGYGMTECGPLIGYCGWKKRKMYSVGKNVDTLKVKIVSRDPHTVPGEVFVKGDPVMLGYYKNEALTNEVLSSDGWLNTGDLGTIDKDGTIFLKGRSKSMILGPSGQNIYPEEIESIANNFPLVSEALAVEREEKLHLLVFPDKDLAKSLELEEEDLAKAIKEYLDELNDKLPGYMHISKIEIMEKPFEVTPKKSIKRFLYTTENMRIHRIKG